MRSGIIKEIASRLLDLFFIRELVDIKGLKRVYVKWTRIFVIAIREFLKDRCSLRASALTFVTLISIVPVLAFAMSLGKGLGFHDRLRDFLVNKITSGVVDDAESGLTQLRFALEKLFDYIDRTNFQTLGAIGTILLVYLVIKLLGNIENAFNDIWGVVTQRSIFRKFSDYLSVVIIFPLFVLLAATGTAALASNKFVVMLTNLGSAGTLFKMLLRYSPYLFLWIAFIAVYMFIPNTRVKFTSALVGSIFGGTIWQFAQWVFFRFQVDVAKYNAIYSTVAALPVFMLWLYLSWIVLLFGAELAFAHQMVRTYRFVEGDKKISRRTSEVLGLSIVYLITKNFTEGKKPAGLKYLSDALGVQPELITPLIDSLLREEIILNAGNDSYSISVSPEKLSVLSVINAVSGEGKSDINLNRIDPAISKFYKDVEEVLNEKYGGLTVGDLMKG